jgi:hypothetical protein
VERERGIRDSRWIDSAGVEAVEGRIAPSSILGIGSVGLLDSGDEV